MESSCRRGRCEVCPALSGSAFMHSLEIPSPATPPSLAFCEFLCCVFSVPEKIFEKARLGVLVELLSVESSFLPRALTLTPYSSTASLFKALASVWQLATFCSYCLCVCMCAREGKCLWIKME